MANSIAMQLQAPYASAHEPVIAGDRKAMLPAGAETAESHQIYRHYDH